VLFRHSREDGNPERLLSGAEHHPGEHDNEIEMRNMLVSELCGAKAEFSTSSALATAHYVLSGVESLSKGIGSGG
jgi:hypothetical protein